MSGLFNFAVHSIIRGIYRGFRPQEKAGIGSVIRKNVNPSPEFAYSAVLDLGLEQSVQGVFYDGMPVEPGNPVFDQFRLEYIT